MGSPDLGDLGVTHTVQDGHALECSGPWSDSDAEPPGTGRLNRLFRDSDRARTRQEGFALRCCVS